MRAVIAKPFHDLPTSLSYRIMTRVVDEVRRYADIVELSGPLATRPFLYYTLANAPDLVLVAYGGHGRDSTHRAAVCGGSGILCDLITYRDARYFKDKVLVCLPACLVGRKLIPYLVSQGMRAGVGAIDPMYVQVDMPERRYFSDMVDYCLAFYRALFRGYSLGDSLEAYRERCSYYIDLYRDHLHEWESADWMYNAAKNNRDVLQGFGDLTWRVT